VIVFLFQGMTMQKLIFAAAALPLCLTVACESRTTGNEGNFVFSYDADDDVRNFNKPIAVGASLDLEVRSVGGGEPPVELSAAAPAEEDAEILEVTSFAGHEVTVKGLAEGEPLLEVTGTDTEGEELSDSVNLLVRIPEVLKLRHTCADGASSAAYLANRRAYIPFDLEMENEQPVIGYGYYPLTSSDPAAVTIVTADSTQRNIAVDMGNTPGAYTLDSDIDDTTLTVNVVTEGQIDGVEQPIAFVVEDIDVGDTNSFYVLPKVGEDLVCQSSITKEVTSNTPEICTVQELLEGEDDDLLEGGWFSITGVAEGECQYTVRYPGGADGAGVEAQFTYPIEP
jgi:hypothetical protein